MGTSARVPDVIRRFESASPGGVEGMTAVSTVAERILQSLGIMDPQEIDLEAIVVFTTLGAR